MAVVHISRLAAARDALEAGADGLMHIFVDAPTEEFAALAATKHAFVVPTLAMYASVWGNSRGPALASDPLIAPFLAPAAKPMLLYQEEPWKLEGYSLANAERAVAMLAAHGVPILAGTDAPNPGTAHGASLHAELELLVEAGLTPLQALASATSVPAAWFHLADRGRIAPGMRADLVLVHGDPTNDIRATREIDGVWRGGVRFDRDAYRRTLDAEIASARGAKPPGTIVGMISDFDGGVPSASFGAGWSKTTFIGSNSTATIAVEQGGANGSTGALHVTGEVVVSNAWFTRWINLPGWAGARFSPNAEPKEPADLSDAQSIAFQARGDGRTYALMVFTKRLGMAPAYRIFTAGPSWEEHHMSFAELGLDGTDITIIAFFALEPGPFAFSLDQVALEPGLRSPQ
jgi:hypothetical protein